MGELTPLVNQVRTVRCSSKYLQVGYCVMGIKRACLPIWSKLAGSWKTLRKEQQALKAPVAQNSKCDEGHLSAGSKAWFSAVGEGKLKLLASLLVLRAVLANSAQHVVMFFFDKFTAVSESRPIQPSSRITREKRKFASVLQAYLDTTGCLFKSWSYNGYIPNSSLTFILGDPQS